MDLKQQRVAPPGLEAGRAHHPGLDLGSVLRDGREPLGLDQLDGARERLGHLGQASVAGVDLGRRRRRGRRVDDPPGGAVERGHPHIGKLGLRRAGPVRGDAAEQVVSAVLGHEQQRAFVPDRLADVGVRGAVPVERLGQQPQLAAARVDDCDLAVPGHVPAARDEPAGDRGAVGRPGGRHAPPFAVSQRLGLAAVGVHEVEVAQQLDVPVVLPGRGECDSLPVGRPRGVLVFEVAVGELRRRRRAVGGRHEEVPPAVAGPALVVELVLESQEAPRAPPLVVLFLVGGVAHPRREGDPRAVRRPDCLAHVLVELGQPLRLAALDRQDVELLRLRLAVRHEREPAAVGRPARSGVDLLPAGQLPRLAPVERNQPDRGRVVVRLAVETPGDVRNSPPVGREARIVGPAELVEVVGAHGHGSKAGRRFPVRGAGKTEPWSHGQTGPPARSRSAAVSA